MNKKFNTRQYRDYLLSDKWRKKRFAKGYQVNWHCELCGKECQRNFEIHHKTYKHFGEERLYELQFLCPECHRKLEIQKRINRMNKGK